MKDGQTQPEQPQQLLPHTYGEAEYLGFSVTESFSSNMASGVFFI